MKKHFVHIIGLVLMTVCALPMGAKDSTTPVRLSPQERYQKQLAETLAYNDYVTRYMSRDISHRIALWAQVGYSALLPYHFDYQMGLNGANDKGFNMYAKGGVGGGIGVGYQLRYQRLLVQTGLEYQQYNSRNILYSSDKKHPLLVRDCEVGLSSPQGTVEATAQYRWSNTADQLRGGYIQLPLLVGMEFWNKQMYFLAGPKLGIGVLHTSTLTTDASLLLHDKELIDPLTGQYTHNTVPTHLSSQQKVRMGFNLALSAEIGIVLDPYLQPKTTKKKLTDGQRFLQSLHTRLAVFAEYGVLNIQQGSNVSGTAPDVPFVMPAAGEPIGLHTPMCSSLQTASASSARMNPLMVGIKLTLCYELPRKQLKTKALPKEPKPKVVEPIIEEEAEVASEEALEAFVEEAVEEAVVPIRINNLFFATNKTDILPSSEGALSTLAQFLADHPAVHICIVGHTDSVGSDIDNRILSDGRANSVMNNLISRGIDASRLTAVGMGESSPIDTNSTEEGRQNNRRVEFIFTQTGDEDISVLIEQYQQ